MKFQGYFRGKSERSAGGRGASKSAGGFGGGGAVSPPPPTGPRGGAPNIFWTLVFPRSLEIAFPVPLSKELYIK